MTRRVERLACALIVLSLLLCGGALAGATASASEAGASAYKEGWRLTFADEFDGDAIDQSKWNILPIGIRYAPRKDGFWFQPDAFVDGRGHLVIQVSERDGGYHAGAISTMGKFEQAYGYYEIRAQLPKEQGFWTAFWLMADGVHQVGNEGRDGTEIDIFESPYSQSDHIHHALHWDGYGTNHRSIGRDVYIPGIYEGFHTFALEWNEDEYIFFVDGVETWRTSAGGISQVPSYLKVTAEVGSWGGDIRKAQLPAQLLVDYVRVYERDHKVVIVSPTRDAVVPADEPIRFQVAPDVATEQVRVLQNGVEIYRGSNVPNELTLSLPIEQPEEEHRLTVIVTDRDRTEHQRSVRFKVQQLSLVIHAPKAGPVRGQLDLRAASGFGDEEGVATAELLLQPIVGGQEVAPTVLYHGNTLPTLSWDTLEWEDGAYDLVLNVETDQGRALQVTRRIQVDNWNVLEEAFEAPVLFFGVPVESMHTVERSDGWVFLRDQPKSFFGDSQRVAASDGEEQYMVWSHPDLRRFYLEMYARDEAVAQEVHFEAAGTGGVWQGVEHELGVAGVSSEGWLKLILTGEVPADLEAQQFRLSVGANAADGHSVQLGTLRLVGMK